jgi:prepilin-type N-terminal cleavage/methylation domain-containing protein
MKFSHKKTKNFNIFRRGKGFSIVEMSIVLLIIGILIAGISRGIDLYADFKIQTAQKLTINSPVSRIEGLALWLETTLEKSFQTKMVNNSEVPQWNNISPFDLNPKNAFSYLFEQNVSKKPTFLENNINGLPVIQFSKSFDNCMSVENGFDNNTENVTIFVVLSLRPNGSGGRIIEKWSNVGKSYPYVLRPNFGIGMYYVTTKYSLSSNSSPNGKIGVPYIVSARRIKSENLSIWLNGAKGGDSWETGTNNTINDSPLYIGCQGSTTRFGSTNAFGDFNVGEIIIYSRALSDGEITRVNKYLSQKWNIKF